MLPFAHLPTDDEVIDLIRSVPTHYVAQRFWVGTGTNWSATSPNTWWSASSGGANNASIPTSAIPVIFDAFSGNCTLDVNEACGLVNMASYTHTLTLGANTLTLNATGTIWTAPVSQSSLSAAASTIVLAPNISGSTFSGGGLTYGNLTITSAGLNFSFTGTNTWATFTSGANSLVFTNPQTATAFNLASCTSIAGSLVQTTGTVTAPAGCVIANSNASGGAFFDATQATDGLGNSGWEFVTPLPIAAEIDAALLGLLQEANFPGISPASVVLLAIPKIAEGIAPLLDCCILTPGEGPEDVEQMSFENDAGVDVIYSYQITLATSSNRDASMPVNMRAWRQTARLALGVTGINPLGISNAVWWVEPAQPGAFLDRNLFPENWFLSTLIVKVHSLEAR